ncbi:MAG: carbohydrate binding family 9 domain-containing protein [Pseudomonadota bacterium]
MFRFPLVFLATMQACTVQAQTLSAARVDKGQAIVIDGHLDEAHWSVAPDFDGFLEFEPNNGKKAPANLRTSVKLLIDDQALVFGIRAWDSAPESMQGSLARRDKVGTEQDFIGIWIDPTGQGQSAQFVRVNIAGVLTDGISRRDVDDDLGPDYPIDAAVQRHPDGYSMEVRWPLSSLRFPYKDGKPWRVMIERSVPHAEGKFLLSVPLKTGVANYMAGMTDIGGMADTVETVRDRRFVEWRPELTVRSGKGPSQGLEINARPRADWVFNATLNPDFSQVEIDEPTNNASRIALSLPEKRGFFLESADVLGLPLAPFYSRTVADPAWGMRATWRSATADATAMSLRDRDGGIVLRGGTYETAAYVQTRETLASFARTRWHSGSGVLGAFVSMRDYGDAGSNVVAGLDGKQNFGPENQATWVLMQSRTTAGFGAAGPQLAPARRGAYLWTQLKHNSEHWINEFELQAISPGFINDNGFVPQSGVVMAKLNLARRLGPRDIGIKLYESEAYLRLHQINTMPGSDVVERRVHPGFWMFGPRQTRIWAEYGVADRQRGHSLGKLHDVPALHMGIETRPAPWISLLETEVSLGKRLDVEADRVGQGGDVVAILKLRFALPFG